MNSYDKYLSWLNNDYFDESTKTELMLIKNKTKEIEDRFYKDLEFGTGGLRGLIGAGTNRMNRYTVRKASQSLANYLIEFLKDEARMRGIAIAYDSRNMSSDFALEAAKVFTGNGIMCYLFDEIRPTPELSFAVRFLNAAAGIVITASHNPKEYNGYKVYSSTGVQLTPEQAEFVLDEINRIDDITSIHLMEKENAIHAGLLKIIGREIDDEYISRLKTLSINPDVLKYFSNDFKLVYTPLHGAGNMLVKRILDEMGLWQLFVVKEQEYPDAEFTNAKPYPNPEEKEVFKQAIKLAGKEKADLIIATDPDCDRVGVVAKKPFGEYFLLTGNQVGALLMEYVLSQKNAENSLYDNDFVIKTIVTTEMARAIAAYYNIKMIDVLTGFKYIGEKAEQMDKTNGGRFLLGFEDSCGYLTGSYARDKDGVMASMLITEMAIYYHLRGLTLYGGLQELYRKYGFYMDVQRSITLKGKDGAKKIDNIMTKLRENSCCSFKGLKIKGIRDYLTQQKHDLATGAIEVLELPKSNVLYYEMEDGSWFCIRPSGTEPKLKIYIEAYDKNVNLARLKLKKVQRRILREIKGNQ